MKKVAFYTLGCKLNFSESSSISRLFEEAGYLKVDFTKSADVYIINTCSVTDNADKKCKKIVKEAKKYSPNSFIAIIGCYAQLKPEEIASIKGVDAVLGASEKFKLIELLGDFERTKETQIFSQEIKEANTFNTSYSINDRTRTFLKVQDGCNYNCSFCTIPLARGKSRSDSIENIIKTARDIAATEVREIVLTGVNIGDFGIIDGKRVERFADLVAELDKIEGIDRIRISSIEPNLLSNEVIEFVSQSQRFVPHFHIPLQSGSDILLKSMRRRYDTQLYRDRVSKIKELMPDCCIGVDVIVGYPGESEEEFLTTYNFLNELDISYLHVFTYSERDNTHAITLEDVVPLKERNKRSKMLRILSEKKRRAFYETQLKTYRPILFENNVSEDGLMTGFTDNYVKIETDYDPLQINTIVKGYLRGFTDSGNVSFVEAVEQPINR